MAGAPIHDPLGDHLLTPQNAALVVIDFQPSQFAGVRSMDRDSAIDLGDLATGGEIQQIHHPLADVNLTRLCRLSIVAVHTELTAG